MRQERKIRKKLQKEAVKNKEKNKLTYSGMMVIMSNSAAPEYRRIPYSR